MRIPRSVWVALFLLWGPLPAVAENLPVEEIVRRVREHEFPARMAAKVRMVLRDKRGGERLRVFDLKRRGTGDAGDAVIRFVEPPEVKGTAFLITKETGKDAVIQMYLPELKRTRRIAGAETNRSFVGSDFSYSDIQLDYFDEGTQRLLRTEALEGTDCYVLESAVEGADEPYDRIEAWVRKDNFIPVQVLFYSRSPKPIKRLTVRAFEKRGAHTIITDTLMETLDKEHSTRMLLQDLQVDIPLDDSEFTRRALERG
ncbi:MAG: outer membrane lipoprotein-sorting protein [Nitrospirae bacterium]|nr:outer membrane lipoprotein-sorting protein [Nitrospirota bacterium]